MKRIVFISAILCVLCGCSTYKSFKSPDINTGSLYGDATVLADTAKSVPAWQVMFPDNQLQSLIQKAISSNVDLEIARLNIEQAEEVLKTSKMAFLPSLTIEPTGGVSSFDNSKAAYTYNLPLTTQWELDIFGKLHNSKRQSQAAVEQTQEYALMVQTLLVSSIANGYYTLIMLDEQLKITNDCIENLKTNLDVIVALKEAGMQTEAAVNQATANYYEIQVSKKSLEKQIRNTENSLVLLINEPPQNIERNSFSEEQSFGVDLSESISIEALSNRPDVKNAEYNLKQNFYGVNVARAALYPSLNLSGSAGWTNNMGGVIVNPGKILLSALGSLTQPLFNKGVNRANLNIAKINYEKSLLSFHQSLLSAGVEVNDALLQCQNSKEKLLLRELQVKANEDAVENSTELMKNSSNTYLEVLIAQNSLLQSRLSQVSDWFEHVQGTINLYKALGGGIN